MKIHIVQRNDTFEKIANKYAVSVQDLVGMNTHINHLAGLVPGLKIKVPVSNRKEEGSVAQHIQKYYPNLDMNAVELKNATTVENKAHKPSNLEIEVKEEAISIPLKPLPNEPTHSAKVELAKQIEKSSIKAGMESVNKELGSCENFMKETLSQVPAHQGYQPLHQFPSGHEGHQPPYQMPPAHEGHQLLHQLPFVHEGYHPGHHPPLVHGWSHGTPMNSSCSYPNMHYGTPPAHGWEIPAHNWVHENPYSSYWQPTPLPFEMPPSYDMMREDERLFFGFPGWGWGRPGWGWSRPGWGWGRPGWGWGRPGWGGHHRSPEEMYQFPLY